MKRPQLSYRVLFIAFFILVLVIPSCRSESISTPPPEIITAESPAQTTYPQLSFPYIPTPPDLAPYALAESLRARSGQPIHRLSLAGQPDQIVGHQRTFWIVDVDATESSQVNATLLHVSPHLYMYVADDKDVSEDVLARSAQEFERVIYPQVTARFGDALPGNIRLTVLHAAIPSVAGYYNPYDEFPTSVNPLSNQQRMIYINVDGINLGSQLYYSVLAHELQHAVHFVADASEEAWVNEGLSTLAEEVASSSSSWPPYFLRNPDTQLNSWPIDNNQTLPHYAAAHLFMRYLQEHYGDAGSGGALKALVSKPGDGIQGIDEYLEDQGHDADFSKVFKDWAITNYLDDPLGGRYSYTGLDFQLSATARITDAESVSGEVHQYATDYVEIELKGEGAKIVFQGSTTTSLLDNQAHSGRRQWWSNRGDSINSTLTREVDLTQVSQATLTFWAWYDIEEGYDHAYVEASTDGGATWDILEATSTTAENPVGNSFGFAYTGVSGGGDEPRWLEENVDLSLYSGRKVLLRFQYITDGAVNAPGLAIDDISIPEIGFLDDAEGDNGWQAEGFVRTNNLLPQRFFLQAILFGDQIRVVDLPLDSTQREELTTSQFGGKVDKVVLAISGATPITTEVAAYQVSVEPMKGD